MGDGRDGFLDTRLDAPRVAVLGPVALGPADALTAVGGRAAARLLLALAASSRPLSIDALTDAVWTVNPPKTHRSALHVHLGALRRRLATEADGPRIVRRGEDYLLELRGWELDSRLAIDLVATSRDALESSPARALDLVEHALDLWRGVPFSSDGEVVDVAAWNHLEAERRDGEELRVEALLATGQAARAETAAMQAVAAEPLRENRWGQLLRARYLAGRPADALATYREARAMLIDQLGLEPGPELQGLEAAALTHDATRLRIPSPAEEPVAGPPPSHGELIGRDDVVRRVAARIATDHRVALLGPPGVGKSRVAVEIARGLPEAKVAWMDMREARHTAPDALRRHTIDWVRRHPDGLIVFDNADAALDSVHDGIHEVTRVAPGVSVIVTSRVPVDGRMNAEILEPLAVPTAGADADVIESTPAVRLLRVALEEMAPTATVSTAAAALLARRSGGLPLVLRLTAATARALPASVMTSLPPSVAHDEIDRATREALLQLPDATVSTFADLSVLEGEFDAELGAGVAGVSDATLAASLVQLVDHGLVQARLDRDCRYSIAEPIRAVAARVLDESGRRAPVQERVVDACIQRATQASRLTIHGDAPGLEARFAEDLPRYREVLDHLSRTDDAERALTLACRLEAPLYTLGWWVEKTELLDVALAIPGHPSPMRARAHTFRARPGPMHLLDVSHAERAEAMAEELGHANLLALARLYRSLHLWWSGETGAAIELLGTVADTFSASRQRLEWCEARKFLGVALVLDGDAATGLEVQRDTLEIVRREFDAPFHVAHNLSYMGHCHRTLGDDTAAHADWSEASRLTQRVGNRGTAIHVTIGLADIAVDRGQRELALELVGEALSLISAGRAATYATWAWTVAVRAHALAGDIESARACVRRALDQAHAGPTGESVRLAVELARLAVAEGQLETAARVLGFMAATPDLRELPFPSPAERQRRSDAEAFVSAKLGADADAHVKAGQRCTLAEAAGSLLTA